MPLPSLPAPRQPLPLPGPGLEVTPAAWGRPNCQTQCLQPHLGGRRAHTSAFSAQEAVLRAPEGQSQPQSLTSPSWALRPGTSCLACQYLLPPFVPSSGPACLLPLPRLSVPPSWSGPPWTQPGQKRDQAHTQLGAVSCASPPCPRSPCGVCQAQALTGRGACPASLPTGK